jgi:hypothetical protein
VHFSARSREFLDKSRSTTHLRNRNAVALAYMGGSLLAAFALRSAPLPAVDIHSLLALQTGVVRPFAAAAIKKLRAQEAAFKCVFSFSAGGAG